jgi:hypothetical protein
VSTQLTEGSIKWIRDLNGVTTTSAFLSTSGDGVAVPDGRKASRVHVRVHHTQASGTLSCNVSLLGFAPAGALGSADRWVYLGGFNNGTSMAVDTSKWSPDANTIQVAEVFTVSPMNYTRFGTRVVAPGGTTTSTTTDIGFPVE